MKHRLAIDIIADFSHPDDARRAVTRALVNTLEPPLITGWYTIQLDDQPAVDTAKETLP